MSKLCGVGAPRQAVIPETVGNYRLLGPLGEGRGGVVYKAVAQDTERPAVVKLVPVERFASEAAREQFMMEARAATRLANPRLRRLYEISESNGQLYLAMEYLEGTTLKSLLVSGPLQIETALAWAVEIADGLVAAHKEGVIHGELVAGKVFITEDGTVKLLDVGLWRLAVPTGIDLSQQANLRNANLPIATVAAMAPEQLSGEAPDASSDIFALGALVYQMVSGRHPFAGRHPVGTMYRVLERTPAPVSEVAQAAPSQLDKVLARALAKDASRRYRSASDVAAALEAVAAGKELPPEKVVVEPPAPTGAPLRLAIGTGIVLLILWLLYLVLTR